MSNKWTLGQMFRKNGKTDASDEKVPEPQNDIVPVQEEKEAPVENRSNTAYLPEVKGSLLKVWELWSQTSVPPLLSLSIPNNGQSSEELALVLERERLRLAVQLEQDAKKRLKLIEKGKERQNFSLNSSCRVYISRDGMYAWVFFFPPYGPEGQSENGELGRALQEAGVIEGIDSDAVVRMLQQPFFELVSIAVGKPATEGSDGKVIELYTREMTKDVVIDDKGVADYRSLNYVRQIKENDHICHIIPPTPGEPGVQVTGKPANPQPVHAAKVPKGENTAISEDGIYLVATRDGHLEFANGAFNVRPLLEIRGDVDYSTGNIDFRGNVHVFGDVREGFEVRATGSVTIDGLVEAATVESGGDLIISCGVVGDNRAQIRSKGCVRVKYLENCVLYTGKAVYADCVMSSQIFSDDTINVTSGRGSVIGGSMTAAYSIRAKMVGAHSGRKTELTLGTLPYVQMELHSIAEELGSIQKEIARLEQDLAYLEESEGPNGTSHRMTEKRIRKAALVMKETQLTERQGELSVIRPDLAKCRFEADDVYTGTSLTIKNQVWKAQENRRFCKLIFDVQNSRIKEIY